MRMEALIIHSGGRIRFLIHILDHERLIITQRLAHTASGTPPRPVQLRWWGHWLDRSVV